MTAIVQNSATLSALADLVRGAARQELLPRFCHTSRRYKADRSLVTEADLAMQARVSEALARLTPAIPVLGEEMTPQEQEALLATGSALWILDPLDGTSNYASGIPYFAVSLALLEAGRLTLGLVYDPNRDELFSARLGEGARLNGEPLRAPPPPPLAGCVAVVDLKRLPAELAGRIAAQPPFASQRSFGAVALDWCWLAAGRGQLYLHGKQNLWDYAAGWLVLSEAGGQACTLDGEPLFEPGLRPRTALGALDGELYAQWRQWILGNAEAGDESG